MVTYPDIRDLQMLQALAQRRHFTQAAADCGISQPAFSARIRHLEKMLGVPVVRRGNKFLGFTKDGELLLKWASKILADAEGLRQEMEVSKGELSIERRVARYFGVGRCTHSLVVCIQTVDRT